MASVMRNISENSNLTLNEDAGYPLGVQILIGLVLAAIICLSLIGNTVVCVAILTERNLRKAGNYFLVSLAIADLLVAGTVMVFAGANDVMGRWIFGRHFCKIWLSLDIMCSTASILNLCAVSLDRYLHVRAPLHYDIKMSTFRAVLAIGLIWACSALISFLPIHLDWHVRTRAIFNGFCMMDLNPIYATASSLVSFYAPCIVMIVLYLRLFQSARRHVRSIRRGTFDRSAYKVSDAKAATTLGIIMEHLHKMDYRSRFVPEPIGCR
ncbi:DgyrCDS873 [Dimorphilus gyrociliatus]|uniref:DgyrCDS873 n=1 Tax=Dimorphilus gyrociliatus TaxID=2664684 RepID=A0A7I8V5K7_9ANNE|nr:DgyrCDS873 [Dimorphilus gyrociliatus]